MWLAKSFLYPEMKENKQLSYVQRIDTENTPLKDTRDSKLQLTG